MTDEKERIITEFDDEPEDGIITADGNKELWEHYRFTAEKGQALLRVDKFLVSHIDKTSRNRIQQAADAGCILVNGKPVKSNYRVKPSTWFLWSWTARNTNSKSYPKTFLST